MTDPTDGQFGLGLLGGGMHSPGISVRGDSGDPARASLVLGGDYADVGSIDLLLRDGRLDVSDPQSKDEPNMQLKLLSAVLVDTDEWQDGDYEAGEEVTGITIHTEQRDYYRRLQTPDDC